MKAFIFYLNLLIVIFLQTCGSNDPDSSDPKSSFEEYRQVRLQENPSFNLFLENIINHYNVPGIAAAVVSMDSILQMGVAGVRKSGTAAKVELTDIFCIGSCTKSMTAVVAAILIEEGILSWETKLSEVFDKIQDKVDKGFQTVILKDLLSHQAGIEPFYSDRLFEIHTIYPFITGNEKEQRKIFTLRQLESGPAYNPGSYSYSNGGYVVAAAIMEEFTNRSWEQLIVERLFKPLNMSSAFIGMPYQKDLSQPSRHYHRDKEGNPVPLPLSERNIPKLFNPAGTVSLSIKDFALYAMFHLKGLAGQDDILKSETIKYLHEPLIESEEDQAYALGWGIRWFGDVKVSGHSGGDQSVFATIGIDHQNLTAGVVLCNMGDHQAESACINVMVEIMP
jgi:CubicO group peptidase (beta-lactamase class C family)